MALTPRQSRFVAEYLKDLSAKGAAIRAGYSEKSAEVAGSRLLSNVKVAAAISEALQRRAERVEVKADDILRELLRLALTDIGKAYDVNGELLPLHQMPEETRRAIAGIERSSHTDQEGNTRETVKVKFWDKTRGLELLGKHLKLFTEKVEHSGTLTLEQLVLAAREKK